MYVLRNDYNNIDDDTYQFHRFLGMRKACGLEKKIIRYYLPYDAKRRIEPFTGSLYNNG